MQGFRVGVIGLGNMGLAHATCIAAREIDGMQLVSVCDIDSKKLANFTSRHPDLNGYTNWRDMVDDDRIDGVIIAVPHPLHGDMVIAFLKKNKHVLVEKPIDITVKKAMAVNRVAIKSEAKFAIMFNQRTHPLYREARELVRSGQLGKLIRTTWIITNWYRTQAYYDSSSWRATWQGEGGGVLLNQAVHNLDLWQWICGMPSTVSADCAVGKFHNIEVEDEVTLFAHYPDGATGIFITSTGEYPGTNRLEICGDRGKLVIEEGKLKFWELAVSERQICFTTDAMEYPSHVVKREIYLKKEPESGHRLILQNFADAVNHNTELIAPGTEGIFSLQLTNAAYLSSWTKENVVIPIDNVSYEKELQSKLKDSVMRKRSLSLATENNDYVKRWNVRW